MTTAFAIAPVATQPVWDAMLLGARSYLAWHGVEVREWSSRIELLGVDAHDELVAHLEGAVQAAAREVVARCGGELVQLGRDPGELRHVRFERVALAEAGATIADASICLARLARFIAGVDELRQAVPSLHDRDEPL